MSQDGTHMSRRERLLHIAMVTPTELASRTGINTARKTSAHAICDLLLEVFRIFPYLQWLNVAVPPVTAGAVLSTAATDSCNTIGWEPNSRQLGVNESVSKIIATINNPKRATLSPARLIGSRVS